MPRNLGSSSWSELLNELVDIARERRSRSLFDQRHSAIDRTDHLGKRFVGNHPVERLVEVLFDLFHGQHVVLDKAVDDDLDLVGADPSLRISLLKRTVLRIEGTDMSVTTKIFSERRKASIEHSLTCIDEQSMMMWSYNRRARSRMLATGSLLMFSRPPGSAGQPES